jgi:hypothetical protein
LVNMVVMIKGRCNELGRKNTVLASMHAPRLTDRRTAQTCSHSCSPGGGLQHSGSI